MTATELLAKAWPVEYRTGDAVCFYCGGRCSADNPAAEHICALFRRASTCRTT